MGFDIGGFLFGVLCGAFITFIAFIKENRKPKYSKKYNKKDKSNSNFKTEETQESEKDDLLWQNIKVTKRTSAFDSKAEQTMYNFLRKELGGTVRIDIHVHMNELFKVIEQDETYFNKLWVCHVDFVVRDRKNPAIIYFAVELDGHESHRFREETIINDKFKTRIFGENNIGILRLGGDVNPYFVPFQPETYPPELVKALKYTKDKIKESNKKEKDKNE